MKPTIPFVILIVLLFPGCATVNVEQDHAHMQEESLRRTGHPIVWQHTPEDTAQTHQMVAELLRDGITRDEAIRISLLNSPHLQASFQSLGIARADVVQAGLYTNPSLGTLFRFPTNGRSGTGVELDLLFRISDLWNVPLRRNLAEVDVLRITQLVIQEVLRTAAAARDTFDELLLQQALYQFMTGNVALFHTTVEELQVCFHAGLVNDLDIYLGKNVLFEGQVDLARIQSSLITARTKLVETLGLDPNKLSIIDIVGDLEDMPLRALSPEQGWEFAAHHRVDLQLRRLQISQTRRLLDWQKARIFGDVELGGQYTRELDKMNSAGPLLVLQIPLFNQNQGGIARAEYQVGQAQQRLKATELAAKQEIQSLLAELTFHKTHAHLFRDKMLVAPSQVSSHKCRNPVAWDRAASDSSRREYRHVGRYYRWAALARSGK